MKKLMEMNTVFILGDSTSMTIGAERHSYPFLMADRACWPDSTEIVNCSQPGFTSADICAFFFRHRNDFPSLKAAVINIGTCDAAAGEIRRGRYTFMRQVASRIKQSAGFKLKRTRPKNRLLHFEWNETFDPALEAPESAEDFEFNVSRIVDACAKDSIAVILVRPRANRLFPPGLGRGNFVFYRYLGLNDKLSTRLSIPDERFRDAMALQDSGDMEGAAVNYREILLHPGKLSSHYEFPLIVVNNYAVCIAEKGDLDEAEFLLSLLMKERANRHEITLFNLAEIYRRRGNEEKYRQAIADSYDRDSSMYRIRAPYLTAIDGIASRKGKKVDVVDLDTFIDDSLYVDHTHTIKEGQERIAGRIIDCLSQRGLSGQLTARVRNILYNLELALGNTTEFYSYYRTYAPFKEDEISGHMDRLQKALAEDASDAQASAVLQSLPKELKTGLEYHLLHPCFPSLRFLVPFGPSYPSDVGRFPEYFLVRHLIPYVRFFEKEPLFADRFSSGTTLLRKSKDLEAILPAEVIPLISPEDPAVNPSVEELRLPAILAVSKHKLLAHLRQGNQVQERIKTTIFWYFRETLRCGSHSRLSMRYERIILEQIAEALAVASIINLKLNAHRDEKIIELIRSLEETVKIHDHYCREFRLGSDNQHLLSEYDARLSEVLSKLESAS